MKRPPMTQVDTMTAGKYFTYVAELMKLHPPHITDEPLIARMRRIGIEPSRSFDTAKADDVVKGALERALPDALKSMRAKIPTLARVVNGWRMNGPLKVEVSVHAHRIRVQWRWSVSAPTCQRTRSTR
jgi:hypothetical protein